jgi:hypothetical protein
MRASLAVYNAGPGTVQCAVARGGPNWVALLPAEKQNYIRVILGATTGWWSALSCYDLWPEVIYTVRVAAIAGGKKEKLEVMRTAVLLNSWAPPGSVTGRSRWQQKWHQFRWSAPKKSRPLRREHIAYFNSNSSGGT